MVSSVQWSNDRSEIGTASYRLGEDYVWNEPLAFLAASSISASDAEGRVPIFVAAPAAPTVPFKN